MQKVSVESSVDPAGANDALVASKDKEGAGTHVHTIL